MSRFDQRQFAQRWYILNRLLDDGTLSRKKFLRYIALRALLSPFLMVLNHKTVKRAMLLRHGQRHLATTQYGERGFLWCEKYQIDLCFRLTCSTNPNSAFCFYVMRLGYATSDITSPTSLPVELKYLLFPMNWTKANARQ